MKSPPSMMRAVLFDFGGTLFSYRPLRQRFADLLVRTAREHGVDGDPRHLVRTYTQASAPVLAAYATRSSYLHRDLFGDQLEAFLRALGSSPASGSRDRFYEGQTEVARPLIAPRPDASSTLVSLRDRGLHLGIVSNIDDDQFAALWDRCGLDGLVDAITTSEAARSCKPDPGIFRLALAKAAVEPSQALFVGDSITHDVAGARAVGLASALLVEAPDDEIPAAAADFVICKLSELLDVVGRPAAGPGSPPVSSDLGPAAHTDEPKRRAEQRVPDSVSPSFRGPRTESRETRDR